MPSYAYSTVAEPANSDNSLPPCAKHGTIIRARTANHEMAIEKDKPIREPYFHTPQSFGLLVFAQGS